MAITFGQKAAAQAPSVSADAVTSAADFSACSLLVGVTVANDAQSQISDSSSNTWETVTSQSNTIFSRVWCVRNPTVSATQTFTASGTNRFAGIAVLGFVGTDTASAVDTSITNFSASGVSLTTGSFSPANDVVVATFAAAVINASTDGTPSAYTAGDKLDLASGQAYGVASAYKIYVGSPGALDIDWAGNGAAGIIHCHAMSILPSAGGGGGTVVRASTFTLMGIQ